MGKMKDEHLEHILNDEIESLESEIDGYEHDLKMVNEENEKLKASNEKLIAFINRISGEMLRNDFVLNEAWHDQAQQLIKSATQI